MQNLALLSQADIERKLKLPILLGEGQNSDYLVQLFYNPYAAGSFKDYTVKVFDKKFGSSEHGKNEYEGIHLVSAIETYNKCIEKFQIVKDANI
jgi:hypothetical protein